MSLISNPADGDTDKDIEYQLFFPWLVTVLKKYNPFWHTKIW
jgi:hypothetical protein